MWLKRHMIHVIHGNFIISGHKMALDNLPELLSNSSKVYSMILCEQQKLSGKILPFVVFHLDQGHTDCIIPQLIRI